jgi:hypothetical protein
MTSRVNLKVSDVTHEAIKAEQQKDETIDDTLQRVLGLSTTPEDIENGIAAYLDSDQREQVKELISFIRNLGEFEESTEEGGGTASRDVLRFVAEDSGLTIATMECSEFSYIVKYRNNDEEMDTVFASVDDADKVDIEDLKEQTRKRVEGALRRWGERSLPR